MPYVETLRALEFLGFGHDAGQRVWISALYAGCAAAVVFFAFSLYASPLGAAVAGLFAVFNAFWLTTLPNVVPFVALIVAALLGGLILRAGLSTPSFGQIVAFAIVSIGLAYVFRNPPHVLLVGAWVLVSVAIVLALAGRGGGRRLLRLFGRALPLAVLLNAWWLLPAILTIGSPAFGETFAAGDPSSFEWTHRRGSVGNALSLNVYWGWTHPEYFPYAARLDSGLLSVLKYCLPVFAGLGAVLARGRQKRIALVLVTTGIVIAFVAKGVHPPLSGLNRWFYAEFPGFWLLREPAKAIVLLALVFSLLAGLAVVRLWEEFRVIAIPVALVALGGNAAYVYPLMNGEVVPDRRGYLPPAHVRVPDGWLQAAHLINREPDEGKLLVLPNYSFYQVSTTWGYHGVPFERLLIRRPVLDLEPGGYFEPAEAIVRLIRSIEGDLLEQRREAVLRKLEALGIAYILLRHDVNRNLSPVEDPIALARGLRTVPGLNRIASFGVLTVYRLEHAYAGEISASIPASFAGPRALLPEGLEALPQRAQLLTPESEGRLRSEGGAMQVARAGRTSIVRVESRTAARGELVVRVSDAFKAVLGGHRLHALPTEERRFPLLGKQGLLTIGDKSFAIRSHPRRSWHNHGLARVGLPASILVWRRDEAASLDPHSAGAVGDCRREDGRSAAEVGLASSVVDREGTQVLRLAARDHSACVSFPVPFEELLRYRVRFEYRAVAGSPARVCLWQESAERCADLPSPERGAGWRRFDATVIPEPKTTGLALFFYADGDGNGRTLTEYRRLRYETYRRSNVALRFAAPLTTGQTLVLAKGELALDTPEPATLAQQIDPHSAGAVGDCRREDGRSAAEVGLASSVVDREGTQVLRLAARDHSACVSFPVPFEELLRYRVRFEYRAVAGSPARVCLWQESAERCADLPSPERGAGWRRFDATVIPEPKTTGLALFFYADGNGQTTTMTEYRNIGVTATEAVAVVASPVAGEVPRVTYDRRGATKFHVRIEGARNPFLLTLTESFDDHWRLKADLSAPGRAEHVLVNGYANGWLIPWQGSYELEISYRPEGLAQAARFISLICLIGVLGWMTLRSRRTSFRALRRLGARAWIGLGYLSR